jgi:hypothetical protein
MLGTIELLTATNPWESILRGAAGIKDADQRDRVGDRCSGNCVENRRTRT